MGASGSPPVDPPASSSGSGCRRVAIILAVIAVAVIGIVVVGGIIFAQRVRDQGISFDVDESGGLSIGEDAGYGDDPELDELWDACADEDWAACDQLFIDSPFLSEYEAFGDTCGNRREEGGGFCVDAFDGGTTPGGSGEGEAYGDDPELDDLWDSCEDGDLAACDELWLTSPFDSEYERFGATCGDRNEEETPGGCEFGDGSTDLPVAPTGGTDTYGDDPELDGLWDSCEAGDMGACDQLFLTSPFDSEYEEFGETCGRTREPGGGICETSG